MPQMVSWLNHITYFVNADLVNTDFSKSRKAGSCLRIFVPGMELSTENGSWWQQIQSIICWRNSSSSAQLKEPSISVIEVEAIVPLDEDINNNKSKGKSGRRFFSIATAVQLAVKKQPKSESKDEESPVSKSGKKENVANAFNLLQASLHTFPARDKTQIQRENQINPPKSRTNKGRVLIAASLDLESAKKDFLLKYKLKSSAKNSTKVKLEEFTIFHKLGTGSFSHVSLSRHKPSGNCYAVKILNKGQLVDMKQVENTIAEKRVLMSLSFPFIVGLHHALKDNSYLYMFLDFVPGGELHSLLNKKDYLSESHARFYAAQILLCFEYLHHLDLIYRDLKPENILLDSRGYIKLTDFSFVKHIPGKRCYTLCGTPDYLAPEVILGKGYNQSVDWWALGVLIFEMTAGYPPFWGDNPMQIYEKIVAGSIRFPSHSSREKRELVSGLCRVDVSARLGNMWGGVNDIKGHGWFDGLDWDALLKQKIKAPYLPEWAGDGDTRNFERYEDTPLVIKKEVEFKGKFKDF